MPTLFQEIEYREQMPPPIDFNTRCLESYVRWLRECVDPPSITYGKSKVPSMYPLTCYGRPVSTGILAFCRS